MLKPLIIHIVLITLHQVTFGQSRGTMYFASESGLFCSQTLILDSTMFYFYESGCEGRSTISFGKYKIGPRNNLHFNPLNFKNLPPVRKVIKNETKNHSDSLITLTFYDRYDRLLDFNFGIRIADTADKVHEFWTDSKGQINVNSSVFKQVSLIQFLSIYGVTESLAISKSSLDIYLNLPKVFLVYPEIRVERIVLNNLQLREQGLYDTKTREIAFKKE